MRHRQIRRLAVLFAAVIMLFSSTAQAYTKLQKGMEGTEVMQMQQALKSLGYSISTDGKYGADTESVVKSFQRQHGLTADGVAGDKTLTLLYSLAAAASDTATVHTSGGTLNLRQSPSSTARVIATIPYGAQVKVLAYDAAWCSVEYGGKTGYVMTQFLQFGSAPVASPTATPAPAQTGTASQAQVVGGDLNLRASPSTGARALTTIPEGAFVTVTARNGDWSSVIYGNYMGYAMTRFLSFTGVTPAATATAKPTAAPAQTPSGVSGQAQVVGGDLNLRASPSTSAKALTTIPEGAFVTVTSYGNDWSAVIYGARSGYVMSKFLSFTGTVPVLTPTPTPKVTPTPTPTPTLAPTSTPGSGTGQTAWVSTSGGTLNLRQSPSGTARVLTTIPNGTQLSLLSRGDVWCAVSYNGVAGYVMTSFLRFAASAATPTPKPTATPTAPPSGGYQIAYVKTSGGSLNLRAKDSGSAKVLTTIPNGTAVTVTARGSAWCAVIYGQYAGYVMTSFLSFTGASAPTATPTATPKATPTAAPAQTPAAASGSALVTTSGGTLNLRASASANARVLTSIPNGSAVTVLSRGNEWTWITYNGTTGYVMTKFLTFLGGTAAATPTPAPGVSEEDDPSVYKRTLKKGMTGADVTWVQTRLQALGYLTKITDVYDDATFAAVKAFQSKNALTVDGCAGSQTFAVLKSENARRADDDPLTYSSLSVNSSGSEVKKLQTDLKALGYPVTVNSEYDVDTHNAVVAFQQRNGLVISGIADALTRTVLHSGNGKPYSTPVAELPANTGWIQGPAVSEIKLLHWVNDIKPTVKSGQTITIFDPNTHLSWNLVFYSLGRHADSQPATWRDTQIMNRSFGNTSWTIHPVYVKLPNGTWTIATMHNRPHLYGSIIDNGFGGHLCVHFLRDMAEAQKNDPNYGVNNQVTLRNAWKALTGETINY